MERVEAGEVLGRARGWLFIAGRGRWAQVLPGMPGSASGNGQRAREGAGTHEELLIQSSRRGRRRRRVEEEAETSSEPNRAQCTRGRASASVGEEAARGGEGSRGTAMTRDSW